jgi:hypothetical protein
MRPVLVVNPRTDAEFVAEAERLTREGADTAAALEAALRERYPRAVVRERGLAAEATTWYVYREGTWVPSESA